MNRFSSPPPEFDNPGRFGFEDFESPEDDLKKEIQDALPKDESAVVKHGQIMINAPCMETMFHTHKGRDFFIIILQYGDQKSIRVKEIRSLEDVHWRFISADKMPEDMFLRLSSNTHDIVELIATAQELKAKNSEFIRAAKINTNQWNNLVELRNKNIKGFKQQKREIKEILIKKYHIKIKPGAELSKLLRLDNIPDNGPLNGFNLSTT